MSVKIIATPTSFSNANAPAVTVNVSIAVDSSGSLSAGNFPVDVAVSDSRADIYKKIEDALVSAYSGLGATKQDVVIL